MPDSISILDRLIALTRELMHIPSTESRPEERARCFDVCRNFLQAVPGVSIREYDSNGFASLVAGPAGLEVPGILLVGHLDVIEHPDVTVYRSTIRDGRLWGPGSGDMKGQCAIMIELFCDLHRRFPGISLGIALTSDEERGGEDGVGYLFEKLGIRCGLAMVPDGGSINRITVEEKGILQIRLRVIGHEGHAAAPWLGPNALKTLALCIARLTQHFDSLQDATSPDHWYPTCVPTICSTPNRTVNCIPGEAEAIVDIRFPYPNTIESMLDVVREIAGPEVIIEPVNTAATTRLSPDPLYLQITEQLTGAPAKLVRASGGSDALFIAQYGIPVVLSSPVVGNLHREDEWMDLASMELYHRICERFLIEKLVVA
ncbi:M20 family metallopeptidase [Phragmitibacter flavus]|uniref:M20 family metallopeptidase n=1 Tax=Phragmitibacter flavus TaxID=2576071 RepID=A0A5R8KCR9_9BACT|nr:M20 family metallopeptidase [Phragmitibacter flavus]TLD69389.1 M20 family metallopeptidase [Phragmitibacter flavus]